MSSMPSKLVQELRLEENIEDKGEKTSLRQQEREREREQKHAHSPEVGKGKPCMAGLRMRRSSGEKVDSCGISICRRY
jgi:hypothetical protein